MYLFLLNAIIFPPWISIILIKFAGSLSTICKQVKGAVYLLYRYFAPFLHKFLESGRRSMSTIAAIATGNAAGGIGVIRISGDEATAVADRVFKAMDFVFKCGYEFEDAYLADWVKDCFGRLSSYSKENENKADLNYALKVLNYCKEHNAELNVAIEKNDKTERILDRWISSLYRSCKEIAESREENNEYWLKTSEKDFAYYNGVVNLLLENGINSVSKTNDYGEEYSAMLQELGLSDRINVVGEM